jgi:Putative transposase DNA-binding domain
VSPAYTSQDCAGCGARIQKSLSGRTHVGTHCGLILDRDENAARNILWRGQRLRGVAGLPAAMNREPVRLEPRRSVRDTLVRDTGGCEQEFHRISGQETPRLRPGDDWPCPLLLCNPLRGLAFGAAEPANCHPSGCPSGVRFPSTKLAVGTFPREALAATPCACLASQVLEQRAEVPPVGRS